MSEKSTEKLIIKPDDIVDVIRTLNRERREILQVNVRPDDKGYELTLKPRRKAIRADA